MAGWIPLDKIVSESSGDAYQIRRGGDGVLYCHNETRGRICQGWLSNKNTLAKSRSSETPRCKHTKAYVEKTKQPYAIFGTGISWGESAPAVSYGPAKGKAPAKVAPSPSASGAAVAKSAAPAAANWRDSLMQEKRAAEARGHRAPPDALAAFEAEIGARLSALVVDEGEE